VHNYVCGTTNAYNPKFRAISPVVRIGIGNSPQANLESGFGINHSRSTGARCSIIILAVGHRGQRIEEIVFVFLTKPLFWLGPETTILNQALYPFKIFIFLFF